MNMCKSLTGDWEQNVSRPRPLVAIKERRDCKQPGKKYILKDYQLIKEFLTFSFASCSSFSFSFLSFSNTSSLCYNQIEILQESST